MKRIISSLLIIFSVLFTLSAQGDRNQRHQWFEEMRQLRVNYVASELNLTPEQRQQFVTNYEAMSRDIDKTMRETRKLAEGVVKKGSATTDLEKEKAAEALFEGKSKEGAIEMRYYAKFKTFLTPDQLLKMKKAEHKFFKTLMKQRRAKNKK